MSISTPPAFQLQTDAIDAEGCFDPRYTCDIDNSSPELRWLNPPEGTRSFVVVAEDPDAPSGPFTHWLIYNIPAAILHLPTGIPAQESLPNGIRQGLNSWKKLGYGGPCPPARDRAHRYVFRIYALRKEPELGSRLSREELLTAIQSQVIASAELVGRYSRHFERAG